MSSDVEIYQQILNAIVEHQLPPGIRLPEDKLSEAFGVSRTGIRKVLQRLALERFVTIQANKGAHVSRPSEKEAKEVFASRILLEPQLIQDVIPNWNKDLSAQFREKVRQEKVADQNKDLARGIQLTAQFHYELAKLADNTVLAEFIEQLCYRSSLVVAAYGSKNSISCECGDHEELLDLLDKGQAQEAKIWMKHHLEHIQSSLSLNIDSDTPINFSKLFSK
jgi:DNA-binding GntR family transcriptional regulator